MGCTSPTTKRFPEAREMSRGRSPRDISRAEGNLEVGGDVQPYTSRFEAVYGHSLIINPSPGMYQEIHPCWVISIDSVKINTPLLMMRKCHILSSVLFCCVNFISIIYICHCYFHTVFYLLSLLYDDHSTLPGLLWPAQMLQRD